MCFEKFICKKSKNKLHLETYKKNNKISNIDLNFIFFFVNELLKISSRKHLSESEKSLYTHYNIL